LVEHQRPKVDHETPSHHLRPCESIVSADLLSTEVDVFINPGW
jgi:hypothetical protein